MKIRGLRATVDLCSGPFCERPSPEQVLATLVVEKKNNSPKVEITLKDNRGLSEIGFKVVLNRIKSQNSVLSSSLPGEDSVEVILDAGHPFIDSFLTELGRTLMEKDIFGSFHPYFHDNVSLVENDKTEDGRLLGKAINEAIHTRKWVVAYGNENSYSSATIFASASGIDMDEENAMDVMNVARIFPDKSKPFVRFLEVEDERTARIRFSIPDFISLEKNLVLVETTK